MTVIADAKRRITLPPSVKPGNAFEMNEVVSDQGWTLWKLKPWGKAPRRKSRRPASAPKTRRKAAAATGPGEA
jgi:hypothetical protein